MDLLFLPAIHSFGKGSSGWTRRLCSLPLFWKVIEILAITDGDIDLTFLDIRWLVDGFATEFQWKRNKTLLTTLRMSRANDTIRIKMPSNSLVLENRKNTLAREAFSPFKLSSCFHSFSNLKYIKDLFLSWLWVTNYTNIVIFSSNPHNWTVIFSRTPCSFFSINRLWYISKLLSIYF